MNIGGIFNIFKAVVLLSFKKTETSIFKRLRKRIATKLCMDNFYESEYFS